MLNLLQTYYRSILASLMVLVATTVGAVNYGTMNRSMSSTASMPTASVSEMYSLAGNGNATIQTSNPFSHKSASATVAASSQRTISSYSAGKGLYSSASQRTSQSSASSTHSVISYNGRSAKTAVAAASAAYGSASVSNISSLGNASSLTKVMNELMHKNSTNDLSHLTNQNENIREVGGIFGGNNKGNNGNHNGWNNGTGNPHKDDTGQNEIVVVPVGDAAIPMLLAALVYAALMFIRRRKSAKAEAEA